MRACTTLTPPVEWVSPPPRVRFAWPALGGAHMCCRYWGQAALPAMPLPTSAQAACIALRRLSSAVIGVGGGVGAFVNWRRRRAWGGRNHVGTQSARRVAPLVTVLGADAGHTLQAAAPWPVLASASLPPSLPVPLPRLWSLPRATTPRELYFPFGHTAQAVFPRRALAAASAWAVTAAMEAGGRMGAK